MTSPVPPIEDADRSQVYETGATTVSTIDLDYPLFGDERDIRVFIDGVLLDTGWTLSTISAIAVSLAEQPITDGRITFSPVIGTGKSIEVRYCRAQRREAQPTSGGIARREFNLIISDVIATLREVRRDVDRIDAGLDPSGEMIASAAAALLSLAAVLQYKDDAQASAEAAAQSAQDAAEASGFDAALYLTKAGNLAGIADTAAARTALGFADVAESGSYGDLTDLPAFGTAALLDTGATANKVLKLDANARASDGLGDLRDIPQNAQTGAYEPVVGDAGKHISITTGGVTVKSGVHAVNDVFSIYNDSASSQTITQGSGVTLRLAGSSSTGNRTLALRGLCTLLCVKANEFVITGAGLT